MILFLPQAQIVNDPDGAAKRIRLTAVVNETTRTVVAERMQRADTFMKRLVGLLGRDGMEEDEALWITPCKGIHTMGMRFPIDALFLDDRLKVVGVREHVAPWKSTGFIKGAASVLELPAGAVQRTAVDVGHQMGFVPDGHGNDDTTSRPVQGGLEDQR